MSSSPYFSAPSSSIHYERARLLIEQRRYKLAIEETMTLLGQEPDSASAYNLLSYSQARLGQFAEAISSAEKAISLAPDTALYHYRLADTHLLRKRYRPGIKAIIIALQLNAQEPDYYEMASILYHDSGKVEDALDFAMQGLQLNPEHQGCLRMRVLIMVNTESFSDADADIERSLRLFPDYAFPHTAKGWTAIHKGQIDTAQEAFKSALQIDPDSDWARRGMKNAIKAKNRFYRILLRYQRWQRQFRRSRPGMFFALWFAIPYLRVVFWLVIGTTLAVGYLFDVFLRFHPYGRLLFTQDEKQFNNCGTFMLAACGVGAIASFYAQTSNFVVAGLLLGICAYTVCFRQVLDHPIIQKILTTVASLCVLAAVLLVLAFIPVIPTAIAAKLAIVSAWIILSLLASGIAFWIIINLYIVLRSKSNRKQTEHRCGRHPPLR